MPDLELPDLAGKARSLRSFGGRPLIINFWATWCAPCRREIPLLRELRQRYRADQLEIVGIAVDISAAVQEYLRYTPIDYPLLVGEQQGLAAAEQFGMEPVLPFSVFADTQGRIVAVKVGELHRDEADFILTEIREVDKGQIGLAQAREQIEAQLKELAVQRAKAQQNGG
jgi:thiol-disulfide isomerase/thioredoxin